MALAGMLGSLQHSAQRGNPTSGRAQRALHAGHNQAQTAERPHGMRVLTPLRTHLASSGSISLCVGSLKQANCGSASSSSSCRSVMVPRHLRMSHSWSWWFLPGNSGRPTSISAKMQPSAHTSTGGP